MPRKTEQKNKFAKMAILVANLDNLTECFASEERRLYAITGAEQMVLDSESMELYLIVEERLEEADPSGLVMEEENVYVTLEGEP